MGAASPRGCTIRRGGHPARTRCPPEGDGGGGAVPGAASWPGRSLPSVGRSASGAEAALPGRGQGCPQRRLPYRGRSLIPRGSVPSRGAASLSSPDSPYAPRGAASSRGAASLSRGAEHPAQMRRPGSRRGAVPGATARRQAARSPSGQPLRTALRAALVPLEPRARRGLTTCPAALT